MVALEEDPEFLRSQGALAARRATEEPDPVGDLKSELAHYDSPVHGMALGPADVPARRDRLEGFGGVLGVKVE